MLLLELEEGDELLVYVLEPLLEVLGVYVLDDAALLAYVPALLDEVPYEERLVDVGLEYPALELLLPV